MQSKQELKIVTPGISSEKTDVSAMKVPRAQQGNMLLSLGITLMITVILSVYGIPKVKSYLIEGAIPAVAQDTQSYLARVQTNALGAGLTPYKGIDQKSFARTVRDTSLQVGDISGEGTGGTTVRHGLGGSGDTGTVTVSETGDTLSLTFKSLAQAACPGLATAMNKSVSTITVNGAVVKSTNDTNTVDVAYQAADAVTNCLDGDVNEMVFTIK
jgi:Tfp pilus assembly major pilin PilA